MREIKFRDYDMDNKVLRYFDLDGYDRQEHDAWGNVMQFTGLKDKNGVEIYEGDIFKGDEPGDAIVVDWNEEKAAFGVNLYGYDSHTGEGGQEVYDSDISLIDVDFMEVSSLIDCEVIGNIHEHPHLLTP